MFRKNTASQFIHFQGVDTATGGIKSGVTWTVRRCIDGTFAAGGGTVTEDSTNGWYKYAMSQADTNGNDIGFNFTGTGAIPQTVNIVTTACDPTSTAFGLSLAKTTNITGFNDIAATDVVSSGAITTSGGAVSTVTTATNVTTVNGLAANVITAASMAADAGTEISAAVWDMDATGHQTQGTFGQAIGDPAADTGTIYKAVVTDATGATVGVDVVDLKTQIGTAGAGLTAIDLPDQTMNITGDITGNLSGSVGSVTGNVGGNVAGSVGSLTTNNDKTGYALSATGSAALTEGYAADGAAATLPQLLYMIWSMLAEANASGTTITTKKLDGSTTAMTFTIDDGTNPTTITRAT